MLMKENGLEFSGQDPVPPALTPRQREVFEILSTKNSQKYLLADWYRGAIYAACSTYNPDRFSQAAQSLRELLEKLPRVFVESETQMSKPNLKEMRAGLYSRLRSDKERYEGEWNGKIIDADLAATIQGVDEYLRLSQMPTRGEKIHSLIGKNDPMHTVLDKRIRGEKFRRFHSAWEFFEGLAHHGTQTDEEKFWQQLSLVERIIIDMLAPITAQDQGAIRAILEKPQPEPDDIERVLELIKRRGANYAYFFKMVDSPVWLDPLQQNGFFANPPDVKAVGENRVNMPLWWPIFYLKRVAEQKPEQVVEIILGLKTDNPRVLREIVSIACDLKDTALSLRLKPLVKRFLKSSYQWDQVKLIIKILKKWGSDQGPSRNAAYEIVKYVVAFQPDPKERENPIQCRDTPESWPDILLMPTPRFRQGEYLKILEEGVRSLAEHDPCRVACILIGAVANMVKLRTHSEDVGDFEKSSDQDHSEIWCRRLDRPNQNYQSSREALVQTLAYACEQVYDRAPKSIDVLEQALRKHRWKVFKRLRQHLYALYPNDQTFPWIREQVLGYEDYSEREYHYEFQLMARKASEHFGARLLNEEERERIFSTILGGPSKEDFRKWMGDQYSEEVFQRHQRHFHRMQLRPFAVLLCEDVRQYFDELEDDVSSKAITDDSYSPYDEVTSGAVGFQSPKSVEELENLTDEELLTYLNDWDDEHTDKDDWLTDVTISALADVFQSFFKEKIVPDDERLAFWLANHDKIARPIYVSAMLEAMLKLVKEKNFDKLDRWLEFCAWVLSHSDTEQPEEYPQPQEKSRDYPDWSSSRRIVVDFIDTCVNEDTDVPISAREGLAKLLRQVCCQPDWRLDCGRPMLLNRDEPITEAINNTRSRALETLIKLGFWIRRQLPKDQLPEVSDILAKRIAQNAEFPLTRPERALLGMHFRNLCVLNRDWAIEHREILFPRANEAVWRDAFGSYILFNHPSTWMLEILRGEFEYAIENIGLLTNEKGDDDKKLIDKLGQHLFVYYLGGVCPLTGDESLLERFYNKTQNDPRCWGRLFGYVGRSLHDSDRQLDKKLTDRVIAFSDWRFGVNEPLELREFIYWLEAECLDPEWRLQAYSKIPDLSGKDVDIPFWVVDVLNELLPDCLALVVECFAKITDVMVKSAQTHVLGDEAEPILKAGLNAENSKVRENAERAKENLLRLGLSTYLNIE